MERQSVSIRFIYHSGTVKTVYRIIKAVFTKDYYSPCTELSAKAYADDAVSITPSDIRRVEFYIGSQLLHNGLPDTVTVRRQGTATIVSVVSRGVTVALCQSEPEPGIWSRADLDDCLRRSGASSEITCESGTITTNYVNIAEGSTSWEAISAYALKAYSSYPYIRSASEIMVTRSTEHKVISAPRILSIDRALNTKNLLSALYMQDLSGDYTTTASDSYADSLGIVREKYLPLDQQWLHDEQQGLNMRLAYSKRASREYRLTYVGYNGEDLTDTAHITDLGSLSTTFEVSAIRIEVSALGIITTLSHYTDGFFE
ncbi:MAG: hypothetical protein IJ571_06930 [Ruminococcus sp.]|nr:hypothetical protein [Ruminococcus sp.]